MGELWKLLPKRILHLSSILYVLLLLCLQVIIQSNSVEAGRVGQKLSLCRCSNRVCLVSVLVITTGLVRCNFLSECQSIVKVPYILNVICRRRCLKVVSLFIDHHIPEDLSHNIDFVKTRPRV